MVSRRQRDRQLHFADYPALTVPHVYVLSRGYKGFLVRTSAVLIPAESFTASSLSLSSSRLLAWSSPGLSVRLCGLADDACSSQLRDFGTSMLLRDNSIELL